MSNTENQLFWSYASIIAAGKRVFIVNPTREQLNLILETENPPLELVYLSDTDYQIEKTKYRSDSAERKFSKDLIIDQSGTLAVQEIDRILKKNSLYFTQKSDQSYLPEYGIFPLSASVGKFLFLDANSSGVFEHLDSQLTDDAQKQPFGVIVSNGKDVMSKLENYAFIQNMEEQAIDQVYVDAIKEELEQLKEKLKAANQKKKADPALQQAVQARDELKAAYDKAMEEINALNALYLKQNDEKQAFVNQITELQAANSNLDAQLANTNKLQKTYQSQADQLRNENKKQLQEHQALKASQEELESKAAAQIAQLTAQLAQVQQEAQDQADQSKAALLVLQAQVTEYQAKNQSLVKEVEREKLIAQKENIILKAELEKFTKQDQQLEALGQQLNHAEEAYQLVANTLKKWVQSNTDFPVPAAPYAQKALVQQWCEQLTQYQPAFRGNLEAVKEIEDLKAKIAQYKLELQASKQQRELDSKAFSQWRKNSSTKAQEQALQTKLAVETQLRLSLEAELKANQEVFEAYELELQRLENALTLALEPKELKLSKDHPVLLKVELLNAKEQLLALENVLKLNQNSQNQLNSALVDKVTELSKLNRSKQRLEEELRLLKVDFERLSQNQPILGVYQHIYGSLKALAPQRAQDLQLLGSASVTTAVSERQAEAQSNEADHENVKFLLKQKIKSVRSLESQQAPAQDKTAESIVSESSQSAIFAPSTESAAERIARQKEKLLKQVQATESTEEAMVGGSNAVEPSETTTEVGEKSKMEMLMEKLKQIKNN